MESDEKKITLVEDGGSTVDFYVLEETRINGRNYLLVTDSAADDKEGECYVLKDLSKSDETDAVYEFVEDDNEIDYLYRIFSELMEDADVAIEKG